MDFTLSAEQELLRDTMRALAREECPSSLVRAYFDDPSVADPLDAHLREFAGLAVGPAVDLSVVLEELGAALVPGVFVPTVALFAPVLTALGDDALLGRVVEGEVTGSVAVHAPYSMPAVEGDRVDVVAVIDEGGVALVERPPGELLPEFDFARRLIDITPAATATAPRSPRGPSAGLARATVALSAELIGATRWMLEATLEYVKTREQFDRPIGSFQALQHRLADMTLLFERAWSSVYWAAMALDEDVDEQHRAVHVAKASASEAARHIAGEALQMHGGIGFTWDHDLHLYLRRAYASEELLGTTSWHRDRLAELVL
jgi:alkylation response protein AidB-like acyl-CoA dehydrogenase